MMWGDWGPQIPFKECHNRLLSVLHKHGHDVQQPVQPHRLDGRIISRPDSEQDDQLPEPDLESELPGDPTVDSTNGVTDNRVKNTKPAPTKPTPTKPTPTKPTPTKPASKPASEPRPLDQIDGLHPLQSAVSDSVIGGTLVDGSLDPLQPVLEMMKDLICDLNNLVPHACVLAFSPFSLTCRCLLLSFGVLAISLLPVTAFSCDCCLIFVSSLISF